ncbi:MAG TPA: Swt1 family HEPN domain-containing protein [Chitinophagales bacterium]|nr:Swt1 family HEPN domain-containing protein [Chitinophagales bacterium]
MVISYCTNEFVIVMLITFLIIALLPLFAIIENFFASFNLFQMLSRNCEAAYSIEQRQDLAYYDELNNIKYKMNNYFVTDLYVPVANLKYAFKAKESLLQVLKELEPDFTHEVTIYPIAPATEKFDELHDNLLELMQNELSVNWLPNDIYDKGVEMSENYLYLYCIENTLRKFIHDAFTSKHGSNYYNLITIPQSVQKKVTDRKRNEAQNKWLSQRGNDLLYYLDFRELADLILNNWNDLFKNYFPSQQWISTKIDELANIRNLIAHNSYINTHDKRVLVTNYHSIVRQLGYV